MQISRNAAELKKSLEEARREKLSVGFVPTMGALHEGHQALMRQSAENHEITVLSIFVNPTQFGPKEDFSVYPRTFDADVKLARAAGVTHIFAPTPEVIYPPGYSTFLEVGGVADPFCGEFRPGHFRGVATVVYRLLRLVQPKVAYFGQKDLQQFLVLLRMVQDLGLPVRLEACPTIREDDGLALSSRNRYLSKEERAKAAIIPKALATVEAEFASGNRDVKALIAAAKKVLKQVKDFKIQYADIRALPDLAEIRRVDGPAALAIAGYLGKTRLIDNTILDL
jgi:pantoate--beta-alanine ligase